MPQDSHPVAMCRHGDSLILAGHCPSGPGLRCPGKNTQRLQYGLTIWWHTLTYYMDKYGQKYQKSIHMVKVQNFCGISKFLSQYPSFLWNWNTLADPWPCGAVPTRAGLFRTELNMEREQNSGRPLWLEGHQGMVIPNQNTGCMNRNMPMVTNWGIESHSWWDDHRTHFTWPWRMLLKIIKLVYFFWFIGHPILSD
jgi:hypothetical protein